MSESKSVVIAGGASGIGDAIASLFMNKKNYQVYIIDQSQPQYGDWFEADLTSPDQIRSAFSKIKQKSPEITAAINCVGIYPTDHSDFENIQPSSIKRTLDSNLVSAILFSQQSLPLLRHRKGTLLHIASSLGLVPEVESPIYCASKAALVMLTKTLALKYSAQNIRVNAICPGPIHTPLLKNAFPTQDDLETYLKRNPLKKAGNAIDVAELAFFLCSKSARYITGGIYTIDGGESLTGFPPT